MSFDANRREEDGPKRGRQCGERGDAATSQEMSTVTSRWRESKERTLPWCLQRKGASIDTLNVDL